MCIRDRYSIFALRESTAILKVEDKIIEIPLEKCSKKIHLQILVCTSSSNFVHICPVAGTTTLAKLACKLKRKFPSFLSEERKADWYYGGKRCVGADTVQSLKIISQGRIVCAFLEFAYKTFKRFKEVNHGWYVSAYSSDAIIFVPNKAIDLFGFGMYNIQQGQESFTIEYKVYIESTEEKKNKATIIKSEKDACITQIFFEESKKPITINAEDKVTISVVYENSDGSSELFYGSGDRNYDSIEGNEYNVFEVKSSDLSENGTDVLSGQIPELYYLAIEC
eukprot:TRINITY_DN12006_c0_g2_i4.p1 TRINITY_DN12006_c0_g2~~TRINITY_DN12006_c0_g2_i4.p1  ORF type:complete len:280 (+),score=28.47 TRINITY_DN12006_c0_g2_i4:73-912(+)